MKSEANALKVSIIQKAAPVKEKVQFWYYRLAKGTLAYSRMQKKASGSGSGQNVLHTVNSAHFQPVNSTLVFSKASPLQNEKIREPEELLQLSEILYFQAFFGIQFCTLVINTTVSTCVEKPT